MERESSGVYALVMGIMQDAGLPHAGCRCRFCASAYADPARTKWAACLALVDTRREPAGVWLFDATPDIKYQLNSLSELLGPRAARAERVRQPDGLFLTHGHMGHTAGLAHLGPEAMAVEALPLFAPARLLDVLARSEIWEPTMAGMRLNSLQAGQSVSLGADIAVTPVAVPHRDEWDAGTFAYLIRGPRRTLLYLPDIDGWELWPAARETVAGVDVALVDASFCSLDEVAERPTVRHPLVPDTVRLFASLPVELILTHLNHTNPLLDEESEERRLTLAAGVKIAERGMRLSL